MNARQFISRLGYTVVNTIAIAILFVSGVTYAEITYVNPAAPVVDARTAR